MNKAVQIVMWLCLSSWSTIVYSKKIEPPYNVIRLSSGESVQLKGFLDYRGEVVFYTSRIAKSLRLVFPYCISGTSNLDPERIIEMSKQEVIIHADVFEVERAIDGDGISTHELVAGVPIKNWCLGSKALRITNIERSN